MAITRGHLVFALIFVVVFIGIIAWQYRKDLKMHRRYYQGSIWVIFGIILLIILFIYLKNKLISY